LGELIHLPDWDELQEEVFSCRKCERLVRWREEVALKKRKAYRDWTYWGKPITGFGDRKAQVLIVGLAPGAHGANRTGRVFTGDDSGSFLFRALHRAGFASQPESSDANDGLVLHQIYISAVCRCVPPDNKPLPEEIQQCMPYLKRETALLPDLKGIVALGGIAFQQVIRLFNYQSCGELRFGHGLIYRPGNGTPWLLASYHPSRQNTQTGRLTEPMFDRIWTQVQQEL
jgi:uracil-DNA glycosylase